MSTQTKRAKTGFAGEFYIYSELIKQDKNCFLTLGNAKSVDIIVIDKNKKAYFIDVKSTSTAMKNSHKHKNYDNSSPLLGRWQLSIKPFWDTHKNNPNKSKYEFADFYIFHRIDTPTQNIIITGSELEKVMHNRIDIILKAKEIKSLSAKHICNWDICDLCINTPYNQWKRIPN
ncbi:MAG: hypothetical protein FJ150_09535 [Euryarchaeota archaeon]|nr:hypothetical protein [Euryarchaeota archaeon]